MSGIIIYSVDGSSELRLVYPISSLKSPCIDRPNRHFKLNMSYGELRLSCQIFSYSLPHLNDNSVFWLLRLNETNKPGPKPNDRTFTLIPESSPSLTLQAELESKPYWPYFEIHRNPSTSRNLDNYHSALLLGPLQSLTISGVPASALAPLQPWILLLTCARASGLVGLLLKEHFLSPRH